MHRSRLATRSFFASLSLAALFSAGEALAAGCPPPTEPKGSQCVLRADATISDTIWIPSGTHLNCQGRRLTPATAGVLDDPRTPANEFQPSQPELALLLHRAYGVKIQNCNISDFDFGIIVAQSKSEDAPPGHGSSGNKILANVIHVRTNAIDLLQSDDVLVSGNRLTYSSERGRGIVVEFDSDDNTITGNWITSTDAASTGLVRQLPLGPAVTNTAIMDNEVHCLHSDRSLQNFVVSGVLIQIPAASSPQASEDSTHTDHNTIELNEVADSGTGPSCTLDPGTPCRTNSDCVGKGICLLKQNSGAGFNARSTDTVVRGNLFTGRMDRAISFAGAAASLVVPDLYPGVCTLDPGRLCSGNGDCNIPGYDQTDKGPCTGVSAGAFDGNTDNLSAESNIAAGTYDTAGLFANNTRGFVFRANLVEGGTSGIRLNAAAIQGMVERNVVSGASNALYLGFQTPLTNAIRLNDFTGHTVAIRTSNDFTTPTDISSDVGNYWGLPCPGFDPTLVLFDNGAVNPHVFDGNPYGQPVATVPEGSLPPPCP